MTVICNKAWKIGRLRTEFNWKSKGGTGRFGGGWNWKVGFQASGRCIIFNLLICSLRFDWLEKEVVGEKSTKV